MTEDLELTLTGEELINEVRDSLAGLDNSKIPDDTIIQTANRFVVPLLNDITRNLDPDEDQESFNSAVIYWTSEKAFDAWLTFTRLRDREIETFLDPKQYREQLKERTNKALRLVNVTRPSEIPNKTVTVKHDGVKRKVNLQQRWVPN